MMICVRLIIGEGRKREGQEVGRPIDPEQSEWPRRDRNAGPKGSGGSSMLWVGAVEVSQEVWLVVTADAPSFQARSWLNWC